MDQPKWLDEAWREFGQRERTGAQDNPRIMALYRDAGHGEIAHDETAWCAAFIGASLARAGHKASGSLMARSYLNWGAALRVAKTGAIAILSRGSNPALGHVGFLIGENGDDIILLGGNQGDAVSVAAFPRSRLVGLRWPSPDDLEQAVPNQPADSPANSASIFGVALAHVLAMEGGYSDDPYDPGGPTNKGITLRVYAQWQHVSVDAGSFGALKDDLRRIPDSVVSDIYRARYWQPASCAKLPPALALMHFDAGVNHGVGTAARILQQALGVAVDGDIGLETLSAVASASAVASGDLSQLLERYAELRRARYRALAHFWRFGRGWLARVDTTLKAATAMQQKLFPSDEKGQNAMTIETPLNPPAMVPAATPKWWGESMTIWGAVLTALATLLPALAAMAGVSLSPDIIREAGTHMAAALQALVALSGTIVTIYGRVQARQPLERRAVSLRL